MIRYTNSATAMSPAKIISIVTSKFFAPASVEFGDYEKGRHDSDVNKVNHHVVNHGTTSAPPGNQIDGVFC
jgi:hypothetical protein